MEWRPIETFEARLEPSFCGDSGTKHYEAIVYGPTWAGGWSASPFDKLPRDLWTGDPQVSIASTYEGQGFWTVDNPGPGDYDAYIKPTHWMPVPTAPPSRQPSRP